MNRFEVKNEIQLLEEVRASAFERLKGCSEYWLRAHLQDKVAYANERIYKLSFETD